MDIKPENCLLVRNEAEPHLILSDFGCAVGLGRVKGLRELRSGDRQSLEAILL